MCLGFIESKIVEHAMFRRGDMARSVLIVSALFHRSFRRRLRHGLEPRLGQVNIALSRTCARLSIQSRLIRSGMRQIASVEVSARSQNGQSLLFRAVGATANFGSKSVAPFVALMSAA
jgi:hypothetical protein